MSDKPCPLCGREMTAIETHAGRGELYCVHCDLVIGGNEAKTPDELMELLEQRTCHIEERHGDWYCTGCGEMVGTCDTASELLIDGNAIELWNFCPNCGRRIEVTA